MIPSLHQLAIPFRAGLNALAFCRSLTVLGRPIAILLQTICARLLLLMLSIVVASWLAATAFSQNSQELTESLPNDKESADSSQQTTPRDRMRLELIRLKSICDRLGLHDEAEICQKWLQALRPDQQRFYLPEAFPAAGELPESARWRDHFLTARRQYAAALYEEAVTAAQSGDDARAYRLFWQVLREDPQHAQAEKLLAPLVAAMTSRPQRRPANNSKELHGLGPAQRWQSRHFAITSLASAVETQQLIEKLERLYALWSQVFYDFWAAPGTLKTRLTNGNAQWPEHKRMEVVYFKDRNEYLKALELAESNIGVSVGYYNSVMQRSFYYCSVDNFETIAHEFTHQFLAEACRFSSDGQRLPLDKTAGAWCIEGIALYMESILPCDEGWTLGGIDSVRLQTARYRALRDLYWPDWQEFTQSSITDWKGDSDIALYYSHAVGLTHAFFDLHPDQPVVRSAYLRYLASIYSGNPSANELRELLGADDEKAAARYRALMAVDNAQLELLALNQPTIKQLVLSRSRLNSWQLLSAFSNLEWLDLSFSNFETEDIESLSGLRRLARLSLEGTQVGNRGLEIIAKLPMLQELDLSQCNVDDAAIEHLAGHANLEILWLSNTQVTDQALETIRSLPKLRKCEVSQTKISPQAWQEFTANHPRLKNH